MSALVSVHPGAVNTEMQAQWKEAYPGIVGKVLMNGMLAFGRDPEQGAYSALYAALSSEVVEKGWNGAYLSDPVSIWPILLITIFTKETRECKRADHLGYTRKRNCPGLRHKPRYSSLGIIREDG